MTKRQNVLVAVECCTDRLYAPLDEAIAYRKEGRTLHFKEKRP